MSVQVVRVSRFEGRLGGEPLCFDLTDSEAIAAHWVEAVAAKPKMYDGRVLLCDGLSIEDGRLSARYAETGFSTFLWWRAKNFPERGVRNVFGAAAVVSSDGAVLLGRMAQHTANAGRVYFPAGTPDLGDVSGDVVDLEGSIARELAEETGLAAPLVTPTDERICVLAGHLVACVRRFDSPLDARELAARVEAHIRAEREPELDGVTLVRSAAELTEASPDYVHAAVERLLLR
ncbi:NUDIX hydrolase [Methylopila henanensis]|uniref:NUDIX hydrolase n=1 Tax=Methylopila henanensis TaxID=873516 RepID=A0ABW4K4T4_9HYPH